MVPQGVPRDRQTRGILAVPMQRLPGQGGPVRDETDRSGDAEGRAGGECGSAGHVEHGLSRVALNMSMSSGVPIAVALAPSAMRLLRPVRTLPAPIS